MQITDVTWAPMLTTQAVDNPFPKVAARPSWIEKGLEWTYNI